MKKNLYLKLGSVLLLGLSLYGVGYGQGSAARSMEQALLEGKLARNGIHFAGIQKKVEQTYRQAILAQQRYPDVLMLAGPSKQFVKDESFAQTSDLTVISPHDIYPQVSTLPQHLVPQYFLIKHNQEFCKWISTLDKQQELTCNSVPQFHKSLQDVRHPVSDDMHWLAGRVDEKIDYFLVGEMHDYSEISQAISHLILNLRFRQPDREILLFTEFLPENTVWGKTVHESPSRMLNLTWRAATAANIPVIGLEPNYVIESSDAGISCYLDPGHDNMEWPVWATVEGARLRNQRWLKTLRAYRQAHPKALFVIYTGGGHIDYTEPYSIGRELAGENTLVVKIYPRSVKSEKRKGRSFIIDDFDALTAGAFPQRVLWFNDPATAQLAGFDIRIKVFIPSFK